MFELILTICLVAGDGSVHCQVPATGIYLNEQACLVDMKAAPDLVLAKLDQAGQPVASVYTQCRPIGPTPKAS